MDLSEPHTAEMAWCKTKVSEMINALASSAQPITDVELTSADADCVRRCAVPEGGAVRPVTKDD